MAVSPNRFRDGIVRIRPKGAVYIEFAVVLPIFLLFLAGIFELARVQNELVWLNQAAYQLALTGATNVKVDGDQKIKEAYDKIIASNHGQLAIELVAPPSNTHYSVLASGKTIVTVTLRGELNTIFKALFGTLLNTSATAAVPYLYLSSSYAPNDIKPTNPTLMSNCNGSPSGSSDEDCRRSVCSSNASSCLTATAPILGP